MNNNNYHIIKLKMFQLQNSPFASFADRINKDLFAWTLRKQHHQQLLKDYEDTLVFVQTQSNLSPIVLVDIGQGEKVFSEGKRLDANIILRMKQDLYVQFSMKEAEKVLKDMITLQKQKIKSAEKEIQKIMVSMREVQQLISQYSTLA